MPEAKFAEKPVKGDAKGFGALKKHYGEDSLISAWIACRTSRRYRVAEGIEAVPASLLGKFVELPVSERTGGVLPGVDLNRSADLEDLMHEP